MLAYTFFNVLSKGVWWQVLLWLAIGAAGHQMLFEGVSHFDDECVSHMVRLVFLFFGFNPYSLLVLLSVPPTPSIARASKSNNIKSTPSSFPFLTSHSFSFKIHMLMLKG